MDAELATLIERSKLAVAAMTPAEYAAMIKAQRESWVRGEMDWPKPKFEWVDGGVKVYASYEDYVND